MSRESMQTRKVRGLVERVLNQISPATVVEIMEQSGLSYNAVKSNLTELRKDGYFTCSQIAKTTYWHKIGEMENKFYYVHEPKVYHAPKEKSSTVAGRREWQAGTTGPLVWKGWEAPARSGAMDAYALPSRGM